MANVIRCPNCAASIESAPTGPYAQCPYCHAALQVGASATPQAEAVSQVVRQTSRAAGAIVVFVALVILVVGGGIVYTVFNVFRAAMPTAAPAPAATTRERHVDLAPPKPVVTVPVPVVEPAPAPKPEPPPAPVAEPEPPAPAGPPTDRAAYQTMRGCFDRADLDGKPGLETVQVGVVHLGSNTTITGAGTRVEHQLAWVLDIGAEAPFFLPTTDSTAPPSLVAAPQVGLGIAVSGDLAIVASQSFATGWSLKERRALWSTQLGGTYPRGQRDEGGFGIDCARLTVHRGVVRIPIEGGRPVEVRATDGAVVGQ